MCVQVSRHLLKSLTDEIILPFYKLKIKVLEVSKFRYKGSMWALVCHKISGFDEIMSRQISKGVKLILSSDLKRPSHY